MVGVKLQVVLVDKFGMVPNVYASHPITGMGVSVYNVSMGKSGIKDL